MSIKHEYILQGVLAAIVCGLLGAVFALNTRDERSQYRDRCACENCRCRCHLQTGVMP